MVLLVGFTSGDQCLLIMNEYIEIVFNKTVFRDHKGSGIPVALQMGQVMRESRPLTAAFTHSQTDAWRRSQHICRPHT